MGGEGSAGQREGETAMQTRWRLPWGVRELKLTLESSPEVDGVSRPYNPSSWDDGPSRKRHLGDSSQKTVKFILKVGLKIQPTSPDPMRVVQRQLSVILLRPPCLPPPPPASALTSPSCHLVWRPPDPVSSGLLLERFVPACKSQLFHF